MVTYNRGAPNFTFGEFTGKDVEIDGENAEHGHNHHVRSVDLFSTTKSV